MGVRLEGDTRKLIRKITRLSQMKKTEINRVIGESLRSSTIQRFREEKEPNGKRWTNSIRASEDGGITLSSTGRLKNSIRTAPTSIGVAVGTNTIYAPTHQFGIRKTIKAKNGNRLRFRVNGRWVSKKSVRVSIPARPYLGISKEDMQEIKGTLEDVLKK